MVAAWHSIHQWLSSRRRLCALGPGDLVISKPSKAFVRSERQGRECLKAKAVWLCFFLPRSQMLKRNCLTCYCLFLSRARSEGYQALGPVKIPGEFLGLEFNCETGDGEAPGPHCELQPRAHPGSWHKLPFVTSTIASDSPL